MTQLQKYIWLIDTIRRAGKISLEEISSRWERNKDLSDYKPLSRTSNHSIFRHDNFIGCFSADKIKMSARK